MADVEKKQLEEKEESGGLGTLIGLSAAAAVPFLRPFRNVAKFRNAFRSLSEGNAKRTTASEVLKPIVKSPGTGIKSVNLPQKVNYKKQQVPAVRLQGEPLVNDRENFFKVQQALGPNDRSPQALFGSSLYDQIKMFPKDKAKPDDWLTYFNQKKGVKYNDGRSASIDQEELFDTNIAALDKSGALRGGLLKTAKDLNMEVDKNTLLAQVRTNPFNRLELRRYTTPVGVEDSVLGMAKEAEQIKKILSTKYLDETGTPITQNLIDDIDDTLGAIGRTFDPSDKAFISDAALNIRNSLKKALEQISDPQDRQMINQAIRNVNGLSEEAVLKMKTSPRLPQHAGSSEYGTYRLEGETNPGEFVWHFKKGELPKGPNRNTGRYHWTDGQFPVVHAMYGTRYTPQGQKVLSINEVQADIQQAVLKDVVKNGRVRVNPEGKDFGNNLVVQNMNQPRETIDRLMKKGLNITEDEKYELSQAFNKLRTARKSLTGTDNINDDTLADYLPFFSNKNYADLAVKTTIKEAGNEGAQWVSVIPTSAISRGNGAIKGNQNFYGYANGKGFQKKGTAIIPEIMKKLANQYRTEAKTIQVSLSDPKKPYKVVGTRDIKRYDGDKDDTGNVVETFKQPYHRRAFKTKEEARAAGYEDDIKYIPEDDPNLYMNVYALRITPDMIQKPMKLYKHKGGLIENVFRPL